MSASLLLPIVRPLRIARERGILVTFAPAPEQLVFTVLLALSVIEAAILWFMPETSGDSRSARFEFFHF
jgi:hypothetical protein